MKIIRFKFFIILPIIVLSTIVKAQVQPVNTIHVKINGTNLSYKAVFEQIEKQSGYSIDFSVNDIDINKTVKVLPKVTKLDSFLGQLLSPVSCTYEVSNGHIVLKSISKKTSTQSPAKKISGVVTDANNQAIIGASVMVMGQKKGVITDINGRFTLDVPTDATIKISSIGYMAQTLPTDGKNEFKVMLNEDNQSLNEVVVVGFATQKKTNLTGAVGVVTAKELDNRPVVKISQALQGLVTGLNVSQNGGSFDDSPKINVRGTGTIGEGSSSSPLILIDGMEGDINALNPQDIDNISVLKDAAASSIYGSRAPFGVILITTKKGKAGKTKVNYKNNFKWVSPTTLPRTLDSYSFAQYFRDAMVNDHTSIPATGRFSDEHLQRILDYQNGKLKTSVPAGDNGQWKDGYDNGNANTDWYGVIFRKTAPSQEHNISMSGGNDLVNYYLSGNLLEQNGLMKLNQDKYRRYTLTGKVNFKMTKWANVNYSSRFIRTSNNRPSEQKNDLYQSLARQAWPTMPAYDPNGYLISFPSPALGLRDGGRDKTQKDQLYQQLQFVFEPVKNWKTFAEFNYKTETDFNSWNLLVTYNHDIHGNPIPFGNKDNQGAAYEYASRDNYANLNLYSEYSFSLNQSHNFKIMGGFQCEDYTTRQFDAQRIGIIVPELVSINGTSGIDAYGKTVAPSISGNYSDWSTAGFFGRLNYDYMSKYLVEINMRYDGTSRFRKSNRWGLFPSASAGWNIAKESFWENMQDMISLFKIRASYGELGNNNTSSYYPTYLNMPINSGGQSSWLINGAKSNVAWAPNPVSSELTWERVRTGDLGLDIAAFNNRFSLSADYYSRSTLDMVGPAITLPATFGFNVPKKNNTELKTTGWELNLSWRDKFDFGLGYSLSVNVGDYRTKITKYFNPTGDISKYYDGKYMGDIWGYETKGIAKTNEEMNAHLAGLPNGGQNALGADWHAGDIMYQDLNNDGKIDGGAGTLANHGDKKVIGNNNPRFPYSIDFTANYKGFDIRAFFQGIGKRDYSQQSYYFWGVNGGAENGGSSGGLWWSTGFVQHLDYFRASDTKSYFGANTDSYYPNPYFRSGKNQKIQSRYLLDAAYLRLKNIQFGYTLPQSLTRKVGCSKLRVYASGENLLTWTKLTDIFDPESIDGGWGGNVYPISKVYSVGLEITL